MRKGLFGHGNCKKASNRTESYTFRRLLVEVDCHSPLHNYNFLILTCEEVVGTFVLLKLRGTHAGSSRSEYVQQYTSEEFLYVLFLLA